MLDTDTIPADRHAKREKERGILKKNALLL
jgi:hypothetical protein